MDNRSYNELRHSDELPSEVKSLIKSFCFLTFSNIRAIVCDQDNIEDYKDAKEAFNKNKMEDPSNLLLLLGNNPMTLIKYYQPKIQFMKAQWDETFAEKAFDFLQSQNLISNDTTKSNWLYTMGYSSNKDDDKKIKWLGNKENLRFFLENWFRDMIDKKKVKFVDIEKCVAMCFINKKEQPMILAKKKLENSIIQDKIENFFRSSQVQV